MDSIRRDTRHDQVDVVEMRAGVARQFVGWSLAYRGTAGFVDGLITALHVPSAPDQRASDIHRLTVAMHQFVMQH